MPPQPPSPAHSPDAPAAILATAVVPWTERFEFDEPAFRRQVHTLANRLTRHLYVFGTAGEGYAVTESQFDAIARAFWESSQESGVSPMLGLISLSLGTIQSRIERGRAMGFRQFQLSLPSWGALNDAELDHFFAETCGRFPDCHFHHYNLMRTKRLLTSVEYRRLADAHPNLVAVKASTSDPAVVADLLTMSPRLRFFMTEMGYTIARRTHEIGLLISLASVHPGKAHAFVRGDDARRVEDGVALQAMVAKLKELSAGKYHIDGAFDKMLYRCTDPSFPLRLLPPYAYASEDDFRRFYEALPSGWKQT
ncbi:MAG: dihydrodipicolinate synthase family protein [Opitutaceae bacterium]